MEEELINQLLSVRCWMSSLKGKDDYATQYSQAQQLGEQMVLTDSGELFHKANVLKQGHSFRQSQW